MTTQQARAKAKFATQVHAEAVAIIALRGLMHSISEHDTPEGIRQRIRDLITVKASMMNLNPCDFDAQLDASDEAIKAADTELARAIQEARA